MSDEPTVETRPLDYESRRPRGGINYHRIGSAFVAAAAVGLLVFLLLPSLNTPHVESPRNHCAMNLRQIGLACRIYANERGGQFPATLNEVLLTQEIASDAFICTETNHT